MSGRYWILAMMSTLPMWGLGGCISLNGIGQDWHLRVLEYVLIAALLD